MWKIIISTDLVVDLDVKQEMIYRIQKCQQNIYKWKKEKHNMENTDNTREISNRRKMRNMFKWRGEKKRTEVKSEDITGWL